MDKKYEISELLLYYVDRYDLKRDPSSENTGLKKRKMEGYRTLRTQLVRIIKKTTVGEISLWDAIMAPDGRHQISIGEFEKQCYREWSRYIQTRYPDSFNESALQADIDRYNVEVQLAKDAEEAVKRQNAALEAGLYLGPPHGETNNNPEIVSDEELLRIGHDMMFEALYSVFFEKFQWNKLLNDLVLVRITDPGAYNAEFIKELNEAQTRLKSYLNYIGKRKEQ